MIGGKISIEHVTNFLSKYFPKGPFDMKFSPNVGKNQSNPHMRSNQTTVHKLRYV